MDDYLVPVVFVLLIIMAGGLAVLHIVDCRRQKIPVISSSLATHTSATALGQLCLAIMHWIPVFALLHTIKVATMNMFEHERGAGTYVAPRLTRTQAAMKYVMVTAFLALAAIVVLAVLFI